MYIYIYIYILYIYIYVYTIQKEKINNWILQFFKKCNKNIFGFAEDMLFTLHVKVSTVQ